METLRLRKQKGPLVYHKYDHYIFLYFSPCCSENYFTGFHTHIMRGVCVRASSSSSSWVLSKTLRQEVSVLWGMCCRLFLLTLSLLFLSPPLLLPLEYSNTGLLFQLPSYPLWSRWTFPGLMVYPCTKTQSSL